MQRRCQTAAPATRPPRRPTSVTFLNLTQASGACSTPQSESGPFSWGCHPRWGQNCVPAQLGDPLTRTTDRRLPPLLGALDGDTVPPPLPRSSVYPGQPNLQRHRYSNQLAATSDALFGKVLRGILFRSSASTCMDCGYASRTREQRRDPILCSSSSGSSPAHGSTSETDLVQQFHLLTPCTSSP